jgi:hypothetical protein
VFQKRAHIDETHLQLQNLAYEKANLVKEIGVARDFRPSTQPIQLIDAAVYDQSIAADQREAVIGSHRFVFCTHQTPKTLCFNVLIYIFSSYMFRYHMARLQHELSERQRLVARVEELTHKKRILAARNTAKRQQFSGMMTHIDNVIKVCIYIFCIQLDIKVSSPVLAFFSGCCTVVFIISSAVRQGSTGPAR